MSLILEALRRSEAERRRAAPPSLLADTGPLRAPQPPAWPIALGGLVLGLLLAAAAAWWWGLGGGPQAVDSPPPMVLPGAAPESRVEPVPSAAYAPAAPPMASTPAIPAARPRPAPPANPTEPSPAALLPIAPAPEAVGNRIEPLPDDAATADDALGPREGDLRWPEVVGDALPPLRVSMHVYADDPARRFAIVDGQRRREGETLRPGLVLLEIRRDGLRIGWQDRVLWVPH